ncbi:translation initiation factor IF-2-like [Schistocerca americana]|uniref:translation initiation factor IF-2-like n=1 Tax=Schistocerca americana TaxID=7009 RepID=UPI001F4F140D|nr:translation initiation factor IF-2-like [Schistocerca americana]
MAGSPKSAPACRRFTVDCTATLPPPPWLRASKRKKPSRALPTHADYTAAPSPGPPCLVARPEVLSVFPAGEVEQGLVAVPLPNKVFPRARTVDPRNLLLTKLATAPSLPPAGILGCSSDAAPTSSALEPPPSHLIRASTRLVARLGKRERGRSPEIPDKRLRRRAAAGPLRARPPNSEGPARRTGHPDEETPGAHFPALRRSQGAKPAPPQPPSPFPAPRTLQKTNFCPPARLQSRGGNLLRARPQWGKFATNIAAGVTSRPPLTPSAPGGGRGGGGGSGSGVMDERDTAARSGAPQWIFRSAALSLAAEAGA